MALQQFKQVLVEEILPKVRKPLRYLGNEYNTVKKDWKAVKLRSLFAFPDVYEVGMSHLGLQILYGLVNEQAEYLMERVFAPWPDMEEELRIRGLPLFSLESLRPLTDFDCIGFTLQYEMSYTNILNILDLGGIPLQAKERGNEKPIIMAGGPCVYNPEPLVDFIDFFVLGEGEEVLLEIFEVMAEHRILRQGKQDKKVLLKELACIQGVYVPAFYKAFYDKKRRFTGIKVKEQGVAPQVVKRVVKDLDHAYFPLKPIVPYLEVVHDRMMLEVLRGCTRGCRFCQAGFLYRPVRERSKDLLLQQAEKISEATGHNEISLTSLSTSDYTGVEALLRETLNLFAGKNIGVSLPSLRVDSFSVNLAKEVQRVRKTGLTFAPEAGTQRLRDVNFLL
ncbi:MAG TPA: TIGR03960 family B12-binding radical SAM protein [Clostridia bacterium]|nr:TIGR03960 family B12-binding radical SAM protein [Clostridia bacterium]